MRIGAHVADDDPLRHAKERDAEIVQFFLADPQSFKTPKPRADAAELRDAEIDVYIHAPYLVNVATTNNRIRIPSRKLLMTHARAAREVGAAGLIVHGGHVGDGDDIAVGFDNWRKALAYAEKDGGFGLPVFIENTASGDNACARGLDAIARLWDAVGGYDVGFCLDTCHFHAAGEPLEDIVERVRAITGRIDLVHANGSRDEFDSRRDRHDNFASSKLDPELVAHVVAQAGAPAVVETPAAGQAADIAYLRENGQR